ncbi:hypothetical protein [Rhodococcus pyridinivorans]|uniref:hypothetical protein n=1 Tax=Rhodococcus pyridinivorans TaxID=103816 RepID=UPI0020788606|nr:hypothetical protein [Rhodococcus pyridinivorans]USI89658.1 hypothetical protein LLA01_19125 [Rhodococcus pyridinivorans]
MTTPSAEPRPVMRDEEGTLYWHSLTAPAVTEVDLDVAPGVRVQIDAAAPAHILAWELHEDADPSAIANAVTDPTVFVAITTARTGASVSLPSLRLTEGWARLALTRAISRWSPKPLDEAALLLDEAAAHQQSGNRIAAARLVALTTPLLENLGHRRLEGLLAGGPGNELTAIAQLAADSVSDKFWGAEIRVLADRLRAEIPSTDEVDRWARGLIDEHSGASALALSVDTHGEPEPEPMFVVSSHRIDPHVVPARVFGWAGAESPEMFAEYQRGAAHVLVSLQLADHLDPQVLYEGQFLAYAADRTTGRLVSTEPMANDDRMLVASLPLFGHEFDSLVFGVFESDTDIRALRTTPLNLELAYIDRLMIDAWTHHRTALAVLHSLDSSAGNSTIDSAQDSVTALMGQARASAVNARNRIQATIASLPSDATAIAELLVARLDAIQRYVVSLRRTAIPDDGMRPLLAEMLPIEPWDDNL